MFRPIFRVHFGALISSLGLPGLNLNEPHHHPVRLPLENLYPKAFRFPGLGVFRREIFQSAASSVELSHDDEALAAACFSRRVVVVVIVAVYVDVVGGFRDEKLSCDDSVVSGALLARVEAGFDPDVSQGGLLAQNDVNEVP